MRRGFTILWYFDTIIPRMNVTQRHMKVEEIAEAIAKLPPDQFAGSALGSRHSRRPH